MGGDGAGGGGEGAGDGEEGKVRSGGVVGGASGAVVLMHVTLMASSAISPNRPPFTPSKTKPPVGIYTEARPQLVPWSPAFVHPRMLALLFTWSVPIPEPYMWYQKPTSAESPSVQLYLRSHTLPSREDSMNT